MAILSFFGRAAGFIGLVTGSDGGTATPVSAANPLPVSPAGVPSSGGKYETVAASQTDQVLGATGAAGDYLSHIVIQPATTGAGTVTVKDGTTVIFTFTAGTLADLSPKTVPFGLFSVNGAWKVTTGANVAVIGCGNFT
jgi:hypothetical protein